MLQIIMTAKVILHAVVAVHKKIMMSMIVCASVIIIDIFLRRVIVDEEVVVNLSPLHLHARLTCPDCRQKNGCRSQELNGP